jgi:hypothetical protein
MAAAFHAAPQNEHLQQHIEQPRHLSPPVSRPAPPDTDRGRDSSIYSDQPLSAFPVRNRQQPASEQQQQHNSFFIFAEDSTTHNTSHSISTSNEFKQMASKVAEDVAALSVPNNSTQQ